MFASIMSMLLALINPHVTPAAKTLQYEVALNTVAVPAQCVQTPNFYTHAFNAPADAIVNGTSGNDIIFAGTESIIHGNAGDDCMVALSETSAYGDAGSDVLISQSGNNILDGGAGSDTAYYHKDSDLLRNIETKVKL